MLNPAGLPAYLPAKIPRGYSAQSGGYKGAWGHVVAKLLLELPIQVPQHLVEKGKTLDGYYIPPRHPNGFP